MSKEVDIIQTLYTQSLSAPSLKNLVCSSGGSDYRVEMHHVRIKDLNPKLRKIDQLMVKRPRKQIPLCRACHLTRISQIGLYPLSGKKLINVFTGEPYDGKLSRTVRERGNGAQDRVRSHQNSHK